MPQIMKPTRVIANQVVAGKVCSLREAIARDSACQDDYPLPEDGPRAAGELERAGKAAEKTAIHRPPRHEPVGG